MDTGPRVPGRAIEHELSPEPISWEKFSRPLTLKFADEGGAMFMDEGNGEAWYLQLNDMTFRPLAEADLHEARPERYLPYQIPEGTKYENGAKAAMEVRRTHLMDQIKALDAMKEKFRRPKAAEVAIEHIMEELGYVLAYLIETSPKELALLTNDLNEIYEDLREANQESEAVAAK
ncbi:MAG: hypothetical protein WC802_03935 [Patescibacteria group bacterium]|jgi:hypothetical protein